jgi:hypothetical protein
MEHDIDIDVDADGDGGVRNSYHSIIPGIRKHRGCSDGDVEPVVGSILHRPWRAGLLTRRQLVAWNWFLHDWEESYGSSGQMSITYTERVSTSVSGVPRTELPYDDAISAINLADVRLAHWNGAFDSVSTKVGLLRPEGRAIIDQLLRNHIRVARGAKIHCHDIAYIGGLMTGYQDNRLCIAAGMAKIGSMLDHLADMYMVNDSSRPWPSNGER